MLKVAVPGTIVSYSYKANPDGESYGALFMLQHGSIEDGEMQDCEFTKLVCQDEKINKYLQSLNFKDRYYDAIAQCQVIKNPKKSEIIWLLTEIPVLKACRYFYDLDDLAVMWAKFNNRMKLVDGAGI